MTSPCALQAMLQIRSDPSCPLPAMLVNADFSRRAVVTAAAQRWVASPQPGVERVMLDRLGGERARATSLVRYAPGSVFAAHAHPGGEEILVLSGTFRDDSGDYGPGSYLRNPPGSAHRPSSPDGALIFVKLWQMPASDCATVRIDTRAADAWQQDGAVARCALHRHGPVQVGLLRLAPGAPLGVDTGGGAEWLLLEGQLNEGAEPFAPFSWMRLPPGAADPAAHFTAGAEGATLYLATGHLARRSG